MMLVNALRALGFTELEAGIYLFLLSENTATGYRIAGAIGKPVANTYKALETLLQKGAVVVDKGKKRLYSINPPEEYLQQLKKQFYTNLDFAEKHFKDIYSITTDSRIYQITQPDMVIERAKGILRNAQKKVVADIFPELITHLVDELEATAARKVEVHIKCYQEISIKGAELYMESRGPKVLKSFHGQWLKLVADANEHIIAFLSADCKTVYQALWSASAFLSILHFNAIRSEMMLDKINNTVKQGYKLGDVKRILAGYSIQDKKKLPGYMKLLGSLKLKKR